MEDAGRMKGCREGGMAVGRDGGRELGRMEGGGVREGWGLLKERPN